MFGVGRARSASYPECDKFFEFNYRELFEHAGV